VHTHTDVDNDIIKVPKDDEGFVQAFRLDQVDEYLEFFKKFGFVGKQQSVHQSCALNINVQTCMLYTDTVQ
jgi:hypothetical protein